MSNEEKRIVLESYKDKAENLRSLQQAYEQKRELAIATTVNTDGIEKAKTDTHKNGTEKKYVDCAAALEAYTIYAEEFSALENRIIKALSGIKDPSVQSVMRKKYLCGLSNKAICVDMGISSETLRRKIAKGIEDVEIGDINGA